MATTISVDCLFPFDASAEYDGYWFKHCFKAYYNFINKWLGWNAEGLSIKALTSRQKEKSQSLHYVFNTLRPRNFYSRVE